jgi:hypothetical protein
MGNLGRPRKILDEELIARFIGKGFTVEYVADYMGVSASTLYDNYSDALRKGRVFRNGCLQAKQLNKAMKGDTTLLIWLGKQWLGQTDKTTVQTSGATFGIGDSPKPGDNATGFIQ